MFPLAIAHQLGVTLQQDAIGAVGVEGAGFSTWSSQEPITGQVVRIDPATMQPAMWGPTFAMMPAFTEKDAFLLGRQDFFAAFGVTFAVEASGPTFVIDC